jgi:SAM-dependent methyltransferase
MATPSQFDQEMIIEGRKHINEFLIRTANLLKDKSGKLLEIGPQDRSTVKETFSNFQIDTFDIVNTFNPTYVGDITKYNAAIQESTYDCVACLEVLEHTLQPFDAIQELRRILKHGGYLLLSAPLNGRIHGPVPDCWRFTEHGWKVLLRDFDIVEIDSLETPNRELFPAKYNVLAICNKYKITSDKELNFRWI